MIVIYTTAYNAEHTLRRTAGSVLSQTHGDWVWYLVDNGSTDATGAMIQEFARRDERIVPRSNRKNFEWEPGNGWWDVLQAYDKNDFFCMIDADDEFKPNFLEKMLDFATVNKLDVAACGSDHIDAKTGSFLDTRILDHDLLIEGREDFSHYFTQYHQFTRACWAKLISLPVMRLRGLPPCLRRRLLYGKDTLLAQELFYGAKRVGILAESLFNYYASEKSASHHWDDQRIESDRILHEAARDFLIDKCRFVSPQNEEFLLLVYMNALYDTLKVLVDAEIPEEQKIIGMLDMFSHEYTKEVAARENIGALLGNAEVFVPRRRMIFALATTRLLSCDILPDDLVDRYCEVGKLVSAVAENADAWVFFKKLNARRLIEKTHAEIGELAELLPKDPDVIDLERQLRRPEKIG
ncbi:MAG: glycosyltransferase family 2 protein [Candidatus Accumulibacter sp.]|jgi:hypothetical protein|nr:glycosyltransferase family 2 protein [Accumulibacter sp.]